MTDRHAFDLDHELSRRKFLAGLGLAGTVVAGSYAIDTWARPIAAGAASNPPKQSGKKRHTVVFVELAGGNDGIGTVIPYTDPNYRQLRPTLAIDNPLDLDGSVGLHPSLAKLADRYRAGQVAIVEGIGYPNNDLSHFASLANWWSGTPGQANATGWLGRYLDQTVGFSDPLAGVVIGPGPSPALVGERSFATSISDASGLQPDAPAWITNPDTLPETWAKFAPRRADRSTLLGQVQAAVGLTSDARAELARILSAAPATGDDDTSTAAAYTNGTPVASLDLAAQLVAAKEPPKVIYVTNIGDYDTHQGQAARQQALHADLDARTGTLLHVGRRRGRRRQRDRRDAVGVRPACTGERQRHRPRRCERALHHRVEGEGRSLRAAHDARHPRLARQPPDGGRLPPGVRDRAWKAGSASTPNRSSAPASNPRQYSHNSSSGRGRYIDSSYVSHQIHVLD